MIWWWLNVTWDRLPGKASSFNAIASISASLREDELLVSKATYDPWYYTINWQSLNLIGPNIFPFFSCNAHFTECIELLCGKMEFMELSKCQMPNAIMPIVQLCNLRKWHYGIWHLAFGDLKYDRSVRVLPHCFKLVLWN